ncbi:MAG: signal peptidase I [Elusimicrobiota bacterium]|nr:signal peptidase I [Elusimicrobiota bacterium]
MELRLLIIGTTAFIFAKTAKYFKKKNLFQNKNFFMAFNALFALIAGGMIYYLLNFMSANGIQGGLSPSKTALIITATVAYAVYNIYKAKNAGKKQTEKIYAFNLDWAETVYFAGFFASVAMFFLLQAFKIPSASMRNTLLEKDNLFVNKIVYGIRLPFMNRKLIKFGDIKRGDVIVFRFPAENKKQINCGEPQYGRDFVKRVVGLPGETVEMKNKQVFINGDLIPSQSYEVYSDHPEQNVDNFLSTEQYQRIWENRELEQYFGLALRDNFGPVTIPQGAYLAIGDNRDFSCDSRFWGPVPEKNIKGKAWFIHWPLSRVSLIK